MTRVLLVLALVSCGDSGIVPDPTGGASNPNGPTTTSTGAGGDGGSPSSTSSTGAGGVGATGAGGDGGTASTGGSSPGGGGSGGQMQGGWESGARLRVKSFTSSDGAKMPVTLYDNLLQAECNPGAATDGTRRCLPSAAYLAPPGPSAYYADAACTTRAVSLGVLSCVTYYEPPKYASDTEQDQGCSETRIYALGPEVSTVYQLSGSVCSPHAFPPSPDATVRSVGAIVAPSTFVELTTAID